MHFYIESNWITSLLLSQINFLLASRKVTNRRALTFRHMPLVITTENYKFTTTAWVEKIFAEAHRYTEIEHLVFLNFMRRSLFLHEFLGNIENFMISTNRTFSGLKVLSRSKIPRVFLNGGHTKSIPNILFLLFPIIWTKQNCGVKNPEGCSMNKSS